MTACEACPENLADPENERSGTSQYRQWRDDPFFDEATQAELRIIAHDPDEIADRFGASLSFGTGGLRGLIGAGTNRINRYTVAQATEGLARFLLDQVDQAEQSPEICRQSVVIVFDSRLHSAWFAEIAAGVLCRHGIRVQLSDDIRPVPLLSFAVRHFRAAAGIMITASHNPAAYNGYKVYGPDGGQITLETAQSIQAAIRSFADYRLPAGRRYAMDMASGHLSMFGSEVDEAYFTYLLDNRINQDQSAWLSDLKVVYTPLHGSGGRFVPEILRRAGCSDVRVVPEQARPDPFFSTVRMPNPENPEALSLAYQLALQSGADLALGTDPDSDRVGLLVPDDAGALKSLTGNQIGILLLEFILRNRANQGRLPEGSFVVTTLVSTRLAGRIARVYGVQLQETLTGFKFIGERIRRFDDEGGQTFVFGFEESFGFLAGTAVRDKDAVQAALLIAEMAAEARHQNETLPARLDRLYREFGYAAEDALSFELAGLAGQERISDIMAGLRQICFDKPGSQLGGLPVKSFSDYLKSENRTTDLPYADVLLWNMGGPLDCDWICARPSGTEPKLKIYMGAYGQNAAWAAARLALYKTAAVDLIRSLMPLEGSLAPVS